MAAEGAREPASDAAFEAPLHPRAVPDRRLVDDARHRLLDMISSGTLRPGDRLGTERELAARLSVSRSTLRQVLAVLAEGGVVRRVPGRAGGTCVARGSWPEPRSCPPPCPAPTTSPPTNWSCRPGAC